MKKTKLISLILMIFLLIIIAVILMLQESQIQTNQAIESNKEQATNSEAGVEIKKNTSTPEYLAPIKGIRGIPENGNDNVFK